MSQGNLLPNKVEIDLNMLRPLVLHRVTGKIYRTDIIAVDNWAESLIIINTRSLSETSENPTGLVSVKRPIGVKLVTKNPLPGD
jgi:hypothetical protein